MRTPLSVHCAFAALLFVFLLAGVASAASPSDPVAAEALFAEGQALMEKGDYEKACPKLEESYRLDPATGALHVLALCHERQGRFASAWVELMDVASRANAERYPERESAARERAEALKKRLSFLTVQVDPDTAALPGVGISRDGVPLGPAAWGTRIPVDPGSHVVIAKAPGYEPYRANVTIGNEPRSETVVVPRLRAIPAVPTVAPAPRASNEGRPELLGVRLTPLRTAGVALGTAGVASFGIAAFSALRALDKNAESEKNCRDDDCEPEGAADRAAAVEAASIATVSAIAGGVLLATGIALFVVGAPESGGTSVSITPSGLRLRSVF